MEIKPPTITKIEISQAVLDILKRTLQSKRIPSLSKEIIQRKIVGICGCGEIPDYIVTRYYDGVSKIERYCAKCLQQEKNNGIIGNG